MFMTMSVLYVFFWRFLYPLVYKTALFLMNFLPSSHRFSVWKKARISPSIRYNLGKTVLFFCPSLGEYQAIKPLISLYSKNLPDLQIEVAFFSPAGYISLSDMKHEADLISYTPLDTSQACDAFFSKRDIKNVIISTLALWPGFLIHLNQHDIPFTFVNARCKPGVLRGIYYRSLRKLYSSAEAIYCTDEFSLDYLNSIMPMSNIQSGGDARVRMILDHYEGSPPNTNLRAGIILASIEQSEENEIINGLNQLFSLRVPITIVPHDIVRAPEISKKVQSKYPMAITHIEVISKMGLLLDLYPQHAIAYVGGGFDKGIHNIAEPLLAGCRIVIGPRTAGDVYAQRATEEKLARVVSHPSEIITNIAGLYKDSTELVQEYTRLDWIIEKGDQVLAIFEEMKTLC